MTTKPYTQRVEVGAYYTDGTDVWEVMSVNALGSVDLRNVATDEPWFAGISAFRRRFWLVKSPADGRDTDG